MGCCFFSANNKTIKLWTIKERKTEKIEQVVSHGPHRFYSSENVLVSQMITSAEFHPVHCNQLEYGSSRGRIRISDLRQAARCDRSVRLFRDRSLFRVKFPFDEVAACISDIKFLVDGIGGQQLISRDYMNMKLWDMLMDSRPVATFRIHEHLGPKLAELYKKDQIFDQFDCCYSRYGLNFATVIS